MHFFFQLMKGFESIHFHYEKGLLDEDTWSGWNHLIQSYLSTAGFQLYWRTRRGVYSSRFQTYVDSLALLTSPVTVGSRQLGQDT